jgi:hypothetical protein
MDNENDYKTYCSRCGAEMDVNSRYCMKCGNLNYSHEANESMRDIMQVQEQTYQIGSGQFIVNNDGGQQFRNFDHPASSLGDKTNEFVAAAGHFGNKSPELVKHYAQDLGYEYMTASNKEEYLAQCDAFFSPEPKEHPVVFEVFTDSDDESDAIHLLRGALADSSGSIKQMARKLLGESLTSKIGKFIPH